MRLHMRSQVAAIGERLAAVGAAERLVAGVRAHVALQQPGARERLVAHGAHVLQLVRQQVHAARELVAIWFAYLNAGIDTYTLPHVGHVFA